MVAALGLHEQAEATSPPKPAEKPTLIDQSILPGYGLKVASADRDALADSSVNIYQRYRTPDGSHALRLGNGSCSGTKVRSGNSTYISTATHCFSELTSSQPGLLDRIEFPNFSYDFIKRAYYNVADPQEYVAKRQSLDAAYGIAAHVQADQAYLKIAPVTDLHPNKPVPKRTYKDIKALPASNDKRANFPGQEVALHSMPSANLDKPVKGTDRYLGQISMLVTGNNKFVTSHMLDIVATNPRRPYIDACNFGAGCSSFVARSGITKKLVASGTLSIRNIITYDRYLVQDFSAQNEKENLINRERATAKTRKEIEQKLGIKIPESTVCGYAAPAPYSTKKSKLRRR